MKIGCLADQHGFLPDIDPCDLLLIAGDVCPVKDHGTLRQFHWLNEEFREWLDEIPAGEVVFIAGNHDFVFEDSLKSLDWLTNSISATYLQDSSYEYEGLKLWGTPWQPEFHNWAFNLNEDQLADKFALIPKDTDILISHGPPYGILDVNGFRYENCGSHSLRSVIGKMNKLKLNVFGHIHHSYGTEQVHEDAPLFINACYVDEGYKPRPEGVIYVEV